MIGGIGWGIFSTDHYWMKFNPCYQIPAEIHFCDIRIRRFREPYSIDCHVSSGWI